MRGSQKVIKALNELLTEELTAIDIYFVQSKMFDDWGYSKIHERLAGEQVDETGHASQLIERILLLGGTPDVASRRPFKLSDNVQEIFQMDVDIEYDVARQLNDAIRVCVEEGDNGTRRILDGLLEDTEHDHIKWLEAQLKQISDLGLEAYLAEQL